MTSDIYKYVKNQKLIEILHKREEKYRKIIKSQAEKHNDNSKIEKLIPQLLSWIPRTRHYLSIWKKQKDIKYHDDFKPIFSEVENKELTRHELKQNEISDLKKGPTFNNIKKITSVNLGLV